MLIPGWSVTFIAGLRVSHGSSNGWRCIVGREDFVLNGWASALLADQAQKAQEAAYPGVADPYLFGPEALGGAQAMSAGVLARDLRSVGIPVLASRNMGQIEASRHGGMIVTLATGRSIGNATTWYKAAHGKTGKRLPRVSGTATMRSTSV